MLHTPQSVGDPSPSPAKQRKPRKPRGRGLRTTTGCAICRRRHMKCDEVKPVCGPCAKGNRPCVYGVPKQSTSSTTSEGEPTTTATASVTASASGVVVNGFTPAEPPRRASDSQLPGPRYEAATVRVQAAWTVPQPNGTHSPLGRSRHPTGQDSLSDPGMGTSLPWTTASFEEPLTITSPQSTFSFNSEVAPLRWFGLLADDAEIESDNPLDRRTAADVSELAAASYPTPQHLQLSTPQLAFAQPIIPTSTPRNSSVPTGDEKELWQSPTSLMDHEIPLFRKFVNQLSLWLDLFDPMRHFSSLVPQLAMNNEGILKAILALSARHASLKPSAEDGGALERTAAVQYYYETLQYLQRAMKYESYTKSLEILATALIVSTYEMVDGAGKSWERHLKGVFWIQRSQDNDGESGGLRQAVWWAWIRQDIWAAFRERRRCFSFWKPKRPYQLMDQFEIASRAVYLLAQSVNYSSDEERAQGETNLQTRIERADHLMRMLDEWSHNLTVHFKPLPLESSLTECGSFRPIWISPPPFAAAVQMHHFSRILLLIHRPAPGGFLEYLNRERQLMEAIDTIVGIALTVTDDAARIISTQCLFAAGLYCQDDTKREVVLRLVEEAQAKTGWPVASLGDELRTEWAKGVPVPS